MADRYIPVDVHLTVKDAQGLGLSAGGQLMRFQIQQKADRLVHRKRALPATEEAELSWFTAGAGALALRRIGVYETLRTMAIVILTGGCLRCGHGRCSRH